MSDPNETDIKKDQVEPIEKISISPAPSEKAKSPDTLSQENVTNHSKEILEQLSKDMIKSSGEYIKEEIDICISDYKLLEQMNKLVTEKYKNLSKYSSSINQEMNKLNESYADLMPLLTQIDEVEKSVNQLEQSAAKLDAYSKRLEAKYKQFTEKILNK